MKRELISSKETPSPDTSLIMWMKLDGNLVEETSGEDIAVMYGFPNSEIRGYTFVDDPTGIGGKGLRRSLTSGSSSNKQGFPYLLFDTREYRTDNPSLFRIFFQSPSSVDRSPYASYLIGLTLEFEVYFVQQTGNRYILNGYDSLYGNNSQMYGVDIYRDGTTVKVRTPSATQNLYTIQNNTWYRFVLDFVAVDSTHYNVVVKLFNNTTLLATYTTPSLIMGSSNKNNRQTLFFNSHYGYFATAANLGDLLRNVKVRYT